MGDSLSAAYNMAIEQSWPALMQNQLNRQNTGVKVINASISGETSIGGLERLPALLDKHQPQFMVLELGGNDGLRGYKFSQTRANLASMIRLAHEADAKVLLIGVRLPPNLGPVYNQRFQQMYQQLAEEFAVAFIPRFLEGIAASDPAYMQADGIHPTSLAQPILADRVLEKVLTLLPE